MPKRRFVVLALIVLLLALLGVALLLSRSRPSRVVPVDDPTAKATAADELTPTIFEPESRQAAAKTEPKHDKAMSTAVEASSDATLPEHSIAPARSTGDNLADMPRTLIDVTTPATVKWIVVHLRDISVPTGGFDWERRLTCVGDFDGDGKADIGLFVMSKDLDHQVWVLSPRDGARISMFHPATSAHHWNSHTCHLLGLGDTNRDGKTELATLTRVVTDDGACSSFLTLVRHGQSDAVWVQQITSSRSLIGASLVRLADVNQDECPDLAVGVASWHDEKARGYVEIRSGFDGNLITTVTGGSNRFHFASEVSASADADGDGIQDVLVTTRFQEFWETGWGHDDPPPQLELRSSASGKLLRTIKLQPRTDGGGSHNWIPNRVIQLRGGRDMNGDGTLDGILRAWTKEGMLQVASGSDGSLHDFEAEPDPNEKDDPDGRAFETYDLDVLPDLDGDGWGECLIGQSFSHNQSSWGSVGIFSTRGGNPIARMEGERADKRFGLSVCWIGDSDGDGEPEFAVHATGKVKIYALRRVQ